MRELGAQPPCAHADSLAVGEMAALGELKSYTENPKTLARLRGDSKVSSATRQKLWDTAVESSMTAKHLM